MRHFLKIGEIDPLPILHAIHSKPYLWDQNKLRTTFPGSPHMESSDIWLFFNGMDEVDTVINDIQTYEYPAWSELPQIRPIIFDLMRRVEGIQLGRLLITKLAPGKKIPPHVDEGSPVSFYSRYQIALQSLPGAVFKIEDEQVSFRSGEVWKINNAAEHSVVNNSADDRIVIIADIKTC